MNDLMLGMVLGMGSMVMGFFANAIWHRLTDKPFVLEAGVKP